MSTATGALLKLAALVGIIYYLFMPPSGEFRLKAGAAACPTKDGVVAWRGANLVGGFVARGMVIAQYKCTFPKDPVRVILPSTFFDLPHRINVNGEVMYTDRDSLQRF